MKKDEKKEVKIINKNRYGGGGGAVYGLGFIGALVYYLQNSADLTAGLIGIFKAIFWPAFLVYEVLSRFNM